MTAYVIFDSTTGAIRMTGVGPKLPETLPPTIDAATSGMAECEPGVAHDTHYWDLNLHGVVPKVTMPMPTITYPGAHQATLSPVPRPCWVRINGARPTMVDDGSAEIVFGASGAYEVTIESVPYLDWVLTIYVNAGRGSSSGKATVAGVKL